MNKINFIHLWAYWVLNKQMETTTTTAKNENIKLNSI